MPRGTKAQPASTNISGSFDGPVKDIFVDVDGSIYVGGLFSSVSGVSANNIAIFSNDHWAALADGTDDEVSAIARLDQSIAVGGWFTIAGSEVAGNFAEWTGSSWIPGPEFLGRYVSTLKPIQSDLIVAGHFIAIDDEPRLGIARRTADGWESIGEGLAPLPGNEYPSPYAVGVVGDSIVVGGHVASASDSAFEYLGLWDGTRWTAFGEPDGIVTAIHVAGPDEIYVGGGFTRIGQVEAKRVAMWNGSAWEPLGSGFNNQVEAFAKLDERLFAAGAFTATGSEGVNYIAEWTGARWVGLGSGANGGIEDLVVYDDRLIVGGHFTMFNGQPAVHFVDFDPSTPGSSESAKEETCDAIAYPNPSSGMVTIEVGGRDRWTWIAVFDISGRHVMTSDEFYSPATVALDLRNLSSGTYAVRVGDARCRSTVIFITLS